MGIEGWQEVQLGDLATIKHGWAFKGEFFEEHVSGKPIVVNIGNFKYTGGFRFESTTLKTYSSEYPEEYVLEPGDILLVMTCQTAGGEILGIPGRIPDDGRVYLHNQRMGKPIITAPDRLDKDFLYWLCLSPSFNRELFLSASGTKILHTAPTRIEAFKFMLPPLDEQKTIAHILGTLDDKIELNQQMNHTLESIARALFKSWFIDFDPVRAKMDGRQPAGMDAETAALFPAEFEDVGAIGKIPKGWKAVPLPEAIEVNPTRSLSKGKLAPYLDMQNMPTQGHRPNGWIYREFGSGTKFIQGDTLLARITPCLENGKTAFVDFLPEAEVGWGSTEYIIFRPKLPLPLEFGYFLARSEELRTHAIQNMTGSSGRQRVPANCFSSYLLTVPSDPIARKFGNAVVPSMMLIKANSEQNAALTSIRDALLPKLLSGEIRVKDAETVVEAVT